MSMHKSPLTPMEEEGLRVHRLPIGQPSQLADSFRHGVAWALRTAAAPSAPAPADNSRAVTPDEDAALHRALIKSVKIIDEPAPAEVPRWTCFHCGETFTDVAAARTHFGAREDAQPGCLERVRLGAERGLLESLRAAEDECQRAWAAVHEETTDAHRAVYAMQSRHAKALQNAEEAGYERGLADAAREAAAAERVMGVLRRWLEARDAFVAAVEPGAPDGPGCKTLSELLDDVEQATASARAVLAGGAK